MYLVTANMLNKSSLLAYFFYSSGSCWDSQKSDGCMTEFNILSSALLVDSLLLPLLVVLVKSYTTPLTLVLFKPCSVLANLILASISCLALEEKGDIEEVTNDMGSALWWRMSALICIRDHLATNGSILMTMTCSCLCLCFEPGGLYNKFCVKILIGLVRVATCIESTSVWIFDTGDIGDLSGSTSVMSTLYPVYGTSILSFTATNDNAIWPKEYMKTKRHIRLEKSPLLCNAFFSDCKSRRGEIIQVFIWDAGNIIMIVLELLTKSNKNVGSPRCWGASSGARANGCLLAIVKQIGCSTPLVLLENASEGAVKFTFYQRLSNYVKLVLITFDLRRTTCCNEYGWRYFTLNSDMPIIGQISSLVFDPGGQKYNLSLVESFRDLCRPLQFPCHVVWHN
ncbi:uncharacterized protein LOC141618589 [Silene latifolia]|uniref:uncharacterized protein LOC141618589 n=1 Tax=Silene latifolia TaxID=37657 RepID=UPI003D771B4E